MGALSGRADVFATGRARAFAAELEDGFGPRVGNRPAALPPGFRPEPAAGMRGRPLTGSGEAIVSWAGAVSGGGADFFGAFGAGECFVAGERFAGEIFGVAGAMIATVVDAVGSSVRLAALPVTVRRTDVTVEAVTGVVSCAWSCRCGALASIGPRSQEEVPSSLPQPKLNLGAPSLAGVARTWRVASGRSPPIAQALMVHWAERPRSMLACELVTSKQRLTCVICDTVVAVLVLVLVAVPVGVGFGLMVRVGSEVGDAVVGVAESLMVLVGVADGDWLSVGSVLLVDGVAVGVAVGVVVGVLVGVVVGLSVGSVLLVGGVVVGLVVGLVDPDGDELDGWLVLVLGLVLGDVVVGAGLVGVAVGVVVLGVAVGAVVVGDGLGIWSGSHDWLAAVVAALAVAVPAVTARLTPEPAASRTLPAISVTVAGRACAKRMKRPYQCCSLLRNDSFSWNVA
jgi:hypothetical protein